MKIDYTNSIVNLTHSLYKHYGLTPWHPTLSVVDDALAQGYNHVAVVLLDGLGNNLLKLHTDATPFFNETKVSEITSVFPSTTAAATTAVLTGKTPYESGYLGWFQYFKDEDIYYTIFKNEDYYDKEKFIPEGFFDTHFKQSTFIDRINEETKVHAKHFFPADIVGKEGYKTFDEGLKQLQKFQRQHDQTLAYVYSVEPDQNQHSHGLLHQSTKDVLSSLNASMKALKATLSKDTLVIVTADHGLSDVEPIPLFDYHDITATFEHLPANEPRMTSFFIKDAMREYFIEFFTQHFGDYFDLYTKEEFLTKKLLGRGEKSPLVDYCLGDFISVAKDKYFFKLTDDKTHHAHHAGITNDEIIVPLMMFAGSEE